MAEQRLSVSIRMTRALLDRLKRAADARSHSMNAEIVQRLEESFDRDPNWIGSVEYISDRLTKSAATYKSIYEINKIISDLLNQNEVNDVVATFIDIRNDLVREHKRMMKDMGYTPISDSIYFGPTLKAL